ncbi:hypothetical protein CQA09_29035, partial [Klebsiella pneumoniae]
PLPIFHIAGILPMTMVLDLGGAYMTIPHFDPGVALKMLGAERASVAYPASSRSCRCRSFTSRAFCR